MAFIYLNRGLILEQAICAEIRKYFNTLKLQDTYKNFNIAVTTEHPFARMYLDSNLRASDTFPCIIVSTGEDTKPQDFNLLSPHIEAVELNKNDIDIILNTKEKIIKEGGIVEEKNIEGLCTVANKEDTELLYKVLEERGAVRGISYRVRRKDNISLEVWAENVQLKNELYEELRLFVLGVLRDVLSQRYEFFDIAIFDDTIIGHRSNNYNMDFGTVLSGSHIGFDVNYCIEEILLDTNIESLNKNIAVEVLKNV